MLSLLERTFYGNIGMASAITGHWSEPVTVLAPPLRLHGGHQFYHAGLLGPRVYLYRDGRDVALSLWRTKAFQHQGARDLGFSEFLRAPLDWHATPRRRAKPYLTIVEHWLAHVNSWDDAPAYFLRYENLLTDRAAEITRLGKFLGLEPDMEALDVEPVGPFPSGDHRVSKWRDGFNSDDLDYFHQIVPADHWGLWNV